MIRLIVVWGKPVPFSLYAHDQVRQEWNQSVLPVIHWRMSRWLGSGDGCLHVTQMLTELWRAKSTKSFGSVHFVCSIKSHIFS